MKLEFKWSFAKDLKRIKNKDVLKQINNIIQEVETTEGIANIKAIKKLQKKGHYYRIRSGDYRIGLVFKDDVLSVL